jgi:hypothetical protein
MATDKLKKLARLAALEDSPAVTTELELERVDFLLDENATKIDEVGKGCETIVTAINTLDQTKADKEDVAQQIESIARIPGRPGNQGPKGDKGDKGDRGEKGETTIVDRIIEKTEIVKEQPIIKTEVIKETVVKEDLTGEAVVSKINALPLEDDKKIGAEHIKGLPQAMSKHYPVGISETRVKALIAETPAGASTYSSLTDVNMTGLADGNMPIWDETTGKWLPGVATSTDEKVKYDAGDPTAGYLGAKVVAGEGITISEGTGTDANKVKISNTWMLDPVEEYWDISDGLPVDPEVGDRYISDGTDEELGWYDGYIYEWDGEEWEETLPIEGMMVWLIFEMVWWVFMSGGWREEGWDSYLALDQTTPQAFTGGTVTGTGLLQVVGGVLGKNVMITVSATAPANPQMGDLWVDIS